MHLLLLDGGWSQTALLVVELVREGARVTLCSPKPPCSSGLERYCNELQSPNIESREYAAFLRQVVATGAFDLVVPLCEPLQSLCWAMPEIKNCFPAVTDMQRGILENRIISSRFAAEQGIPLPREMAVQDEGDLQAVAAELGYPFVLRGTQGLGGQQVRIVSTAAAAMLAYSELVALSPEKPFAQEYLDGERCLLGALLDHGHIIQSFGQRTLECYPPPTGPSIRVTSFPDPALVAYGERILSALQWTGLACAEFIRLRDGSFRFLEINPRPWAAIQASTVAGVPLIRMFAQFLMGRREFKPVRYEPNRRCTIFPAYLDAKINARQKLASSDIPACLSLIFSIPWSSPSLTFYTLKRLYWGFRTNWIASRQRFGSESR